MVKLKYSNLRSSEVLKKSFIAVFIYKAIQVGIYLR